jgi:G3E family GTPase
MGITPVKLAPEGTMSASPLIPIVVLASVDPVLRSSASFAALTDMPDTVVITQDIDADRDAPIHRLVSDSTGILLDEWVDLDHACLSCALREDTIPLIERLISGGRHRNILVAAPVGAQTVPIARALHAATAPCGTLSAARLASVAAACDVGTLSHDLLGDDLLSERRLGMGADDHRSVGEVLAHQVGHADFILTAAPLADAAPADSALLEHVRGPGSHMVEDYLSAHMRTVFDHSHLCEHALRRVHPLHVAHNGAPERDGVWTMHLTSSRPMHPARMLDQIEALASEQVFSRGHFWVATRPLTACVWDGAGAQLSIGTFGEWGTHAPRTSLVFTGLADQRRDIVEAFDAVLLTPEEAAAGLGQFLGRDDGLDPWLGRRGDDGQG